jgi:DNA polymerase-3 subunit delta'
MIADENKQGVIYVDEARDLMSKFNQKSYEAEYKVSIVWLPALMNITCANKILKILEEPPEKTIFILVSEAENKLLSTIRSRCQFIRVPKIADEDMQQALFDLPEFDGANHTAIARLARGNYYLAIEMIRNDEVRKFNFNQFALMMRNGYGRKLAEILSWSEEIATIGRVKQMGFLKYCGEFLRENFIFNMKEPELVYMDVQENEFSMKFSPFINERNVINLFREFEKAYTDVSMNGNAKLIFTDLGFKVSKLIRS